MTLESFRELGDDYDSEVPDVIVHTGNFKVRRAFWQSLVFDLEDGLQNGTIPGNLADEARGLLGHITSDEFRGRSLTAPEDIQRADGLLDKILGRC